MDAGAPLPTAHVAEAVVGRLAGFAELLRANEIPIGADELVDAVEVLETLDLRDEGSVYWGLRMVMARRARDIRRYDELYRAYWLGMPLSMRAVVSDPGDEPESEGAVEALFMPGPPDDDDGATPGSRAAYSRIEVLRGKDFEAYTAADYLLLDELLAQLRLGGPWRTTRRRRAHRKGRLDVARTVRAGIRAGGDPVRRLNRRPRVKHRRLTFVCDVSGSMERYAHAVLALSQAALNERSRVEAFAFATRLTRLTDDLVRRDTDVAVKRAVESLVDWSGGTRVGDSMAQLNRHHRSAVRGAVVVIASDGWDLGDPERLADEAALLHRMAHHVVWLNPHLRDPRFEPLAKGMASALPHVDTFLTCHNFESFRALAALLREL